MGMPEGNPSIKITDLGTIFQSNEKHSMVAESLEEYAMESAEAAYADPG